MSRKQGKFAIYMWRNGGLAFRPKGLGGKAHFEARGKTAIAVIVSWFALLLAAIL